MYESLKSYKPSEILGNASKQDASLRKAIVDQRSMNRSGGQGLWQLAPSHKSPIQGMSPEQLTSIFNVIRRLYIK